MYVAPSRKMFRRRTRLDNAAAEIASLREANNRLVKIMNESLKLQIKLYGALKMFADGSNWIGTVEGRYEWAAEGKPEEIARMAIGDLAPKQPAAPEPEGPFSDWPKPDQLLITDERLVREVTEMPAPENN